MQIKVYAIEVKIPRWAKRAMVFGVIPVVVLLGTVHYLRAADVSVPHSFSNNDVLSALDMNENFDALKTGINNLAATVTTLQGTVGSAVPAGTVVAFAGPVAPTGWLRCDGAAVKRGAYAALFNFLGTVHGSGGGGRTFDLPDYRGRFLRGVDGDAGNDPDAASRVAAKAGGNSGNLVGSLQSGATALPTSPFALASSGSHSHYLGGINDPSIVSGHLSSYSGYNGTWSLSASGPFGGSNTTSSGDHSHAVSGGDRESRPVNVAVNYIIKY
jgi:microcystin-dependent protein